MQMMPVPYDVDLGHPMSRSMLSKTGQNGILNLLGFAGGELGNIASSVRYDNRTIDGHPVDNGSDVNSVGMQMMNAFSAQTPQLPAPAVQMGMQPMGAMPAVDPQQYQYQSNQYMPMKKEKVTIDKYIGGQAAPQRPQVGGFAEAVEPLDDKMEVMCQLLGRIYQSQNALIALLRNLPNEISEMMNPRVEDYLPPVDTSNDPPPPTEEELYGELPPPPADYPYAGGDEEMEGLEEIDDAAEGGVEEDEEEGVPVPSPKPAARRTVKRKK